MPTYQYHCAACDHDMEVLQKITEDALRVCPKCGKETLARGPGGGVGLSFKGSGFYINDYALPSKGSGEQSGGSKSDSKGDSKSGSGGCCPCGKNKNSCSDQAQAYVRTKTQRGKEAKAQRQ